MDRDEYNRLLREASVDNTSKFVRINEERPKTRGRPPTHYHPLLQKEKELTKILNDTLPDSVATSLRPRGTRLAHLYGLPKTHKSTLCMRPILSATNTYNYQLAKWLEDKLKPLSTNEYTVSDAFRCAEEIRSLSVKEEDLLVSYDVSALFTNVPLKETINIIVDKAFTDDWFNRTYNLNLQRQDLMKLLEVSTSNQLFQFNGQLYEQTDGVAMGSPLGPLTANVFMCHLEEQLTTNLADNFPTLYMRYVDDTLVSMPDVPSAQHFLETLNNLHANLNFTMELPCDNKISFIGFEIVKNGTILETRVYRKPTNTGLLLHYQSHADVRYKDSLIKTMLHRAKSLSSTDEYFQQECSKLRSIFTRLGYPLGLINSIIKNFDRVSPTRGQDSTTTDKIVRINIPFKDQKSASAVRKQLKELNHKINNVTIQPIFTSRKLEQDLKPKEKKPDLVNQNCVVYIFKCDLCDADYVGMTTRHLHQRIVEHKQSSIGNHFREHHGSLLGLKSSQFHVLKKCNSKFNCLVFEMLFIRKLKPSLNVQSDSINAKLFT